MNLHDTLEALWRSPTVRAMDHDGNLRDQLRRKREALTPVFVVGACADTAADCISRGEVQVTDPALQWLTARTVVYGDADGGCAEAYADEWGHPVERRSTGAAR